MATATLKKILVASGVLILVLSLVGLPQLVMAQERGLWMDRNFNRLIPLGFGGGFGENLGNLFILDQLFNSGCGLLGCPLGVNSLLNNGISLGNLLVLNQLFGGDRIFR